MSLFTKYGGAPTIGRIVASFYGVVLSRPHLKVYFDGVPLQRLMQHQIRFISVVMGQTPGVYNGRSMHEAHGRLKISAEHFTEVGAILASALRQAGMEEADLQTVIAAVANLQSDIVAS